MFHRWHKHAMKNITNIYRKKTQYIYCIRISIDVNLLSIRYHGLFLQPDYKRIHNFRLKHDDLIDYDCIFCCTRAQIGNLIGLRQCLYNVMRLKSHFYYIDGINRIANPPNCKQIYGFLSNHNSHIFQRFFKCSKR